jgi:thiosulfate/3-mercaptopyruvate sulfurtransferase
MVPPVVDMSWVEASSAEIVLADVRWYVDGRSGREAYERGHLHGAVFVDLDRWLAGDPRAGRGRHPLPEPESFAAGMSALGIGDASAVVGYDDEGGVIAARLVWMLRAIGHDAALLDGGLKAYEGPLETGYPVVAGAQFTARQWPAELLADIHDAAHPTNVVLDARAIERYQGKVEPVDPRAGHIPGAVSLPCRENLDQDGRFLPVKALRERFEAAGVQDGASVVSYCGSGVTACHNLLALEYCGLGQGRLYPGSWSEYSATDRPVAT